MIWVFLAVMGLILIIGIYSFFNKRAFISLFNRGNCIVTGLRGCGKDMAFAVVINARKKNYISNVQYTNPKKKYKRFDFDIKVWELAQNTYKNFTDNSVKKYVYPYPDDIDYYISDAGVYFPSQYCTELVKKYTSVPLFQALSRHLGDCNVHCNVQNIGRLWDKIREQSDIYIRMDKCRVIGKIVFLRSYVYETEESCALRLVPPNFGFGKHAKDRKNAWLTAHGRVRKLSFFTRLPYAYDSRSFKRILENGCVGYEDKKEIKIIEKK